MSQHTVTATFNTVSGKKHSFLGNLSLQGTYDKHKDLFVMSPASWASLALNTTTVCGRFKWKTGATLHIWVTASNKNISIPLPVTYETFLNAMHETFHLSNRTSYIILTVML